MFATGPSIDMRPTLFGEARWYQELEAPDSAGPHAWFVTKDTDNEWTERLLSVACLFAREHGLLPHYQRRFAGIDSAELRAERARREGRTVAFPIWQIANELIVAVYLERALGWGFETHEPPGRGSHRGDWQFRTSAGSSVFVEVKSFAEPDWSESGSGIRPDYRPRIRNALREAYAQLPNDGRGTLVVLCGYEITRIPFGIPHGDVFQALFGQWQLKFRIDVPQPSPISAGPSFWDTFVQGGKHRRLGVTAGMSISGAYDPRLQFYAIENPYCHPSVRLPHSALNEVERFCVSGWRGNVHEGISPAEAWSRIVPETQKERWIRNAI